jgi:MFS family permease
MGPRNFLTLVLSIHGGALMDRLGTRRVMIAFGLASTVTRFAQLHWLVIVSVMLTAIAIAVTPLLGGIYVILLAVLAIRGVFLGISQPLEISIFSRALRRDQQGQGAGLRATMN